MPITISPSKLQDAVEEGFKRTQNFRSARVMFLRQFVGQYFDAEKGTVGTEPLNLIFNAIRVLLPNLVFSYPRHNVTTRFLAHRDYGDMLGMALSQQDKQLKITETYRRWIVDSLFTIGILKTGMCDSGTAIHFDQDDAIDPGTVYTAGVDFDNFVFDPNARNLEEALFLGDKLRVPRASLLESGLYRNDLIEKLPAVGNTPYNTEYAAELSATNVNLYDTARLEDEVEIVELWVPRANALITVPACGYRADEFLRETEYNGPDEGPYTFLRMTPPVPDNPLPISLVGIWYDLHVMANRMATKILNQADRQKDVTLYKRGSADDAQELLDAADGEAIAVDDPEGVTVQSFGGQNVKNEAVMPQLERWFNMIAGNPEGQAGLSMQAGSATEASILQGNAATTLADMKDMVYSGVAAEGRKRAWYLHTDPLLEVPLIRRVKIPSAPMQTPMGQMPGPVEERDIQVMLTPEARSGDFLDFTFEIEPESMGRVDSKQRYNQAMEFAVKIIPAAAQAAMTCVQMGIPFSFPRFVAKLAKEAGINWMDEVFQDPELQQRMMMQMMRGPQAEGSKGSSQPNADGGIAQNGQPGQVASVASPEQIPNMMAQEGANAGQADLSIRPSY